MDLITDRYTFLDNLSYQVKVSQDYGHQSGCKNIKLGSCLVVKV